MKPLLLHIETSTFEGSIAVSQGEEVLREASLPVGEKYIRTLPASVEQLLAQTNLSFNQLQGISISAGPGSYTGLRIGTSFAKGLCFGLQIPLLSVPTLNILAQSIFEQYTTDVAVPLLDARRMEVYTAAFKRDGTELMPVQPLVVDETSFSFLKGSECVFAGNAATKCREVLEAHQGFTVDTTINLSASYMATLATTGFMNEEWEDIAAFEPVYLKEFQVGKSSKISKILRG